MGGLLSLVKRVHKRKNLGLLRKREWNRAGIRGYVSGSEGVELGFGKNCGR